MEYRPHPEYKKYIESFDHGFVDIYKENGEIKYKIVKDQPISQLDVEMAEYRIKELYDYEVPDGMDIRDITIPGSDPEQKLTLRIYTPASVKKPSPVIMDIHGGGWIGGSLDIDNSRAIALASGTPCIVVSVDYRICRNGVHYPAPLMDVYTAYQWLCKNAEKVGGDPGRIGLHGTSAGGNLCAGLALYLRDHQGQTPVLTAINCPALYVDGNEFASAYQYKTSKNDGYGKASDPFALYIGGWEGNLPSYYAAPGHCPDLSGLGPHAIYVAEYDTLRDDGIRYAVRLINSGVPCEMVVTGRVCHAFTGVSGSVTDWIHEGMCMAFQREFGMIPEV